MAIFIIAKTKNSETSEFELKTKIEIGRSLSCDLSFPGDEKMSGNHGKLHLGPDGDIHFTDLNSRNKSTIDHKQITSAILRIGETLKLGSTTFIIDESRLNATEALSISNSDLSKTHPEDKTARIASSSLISRAQFDKKIVKKTPSLSERWNDGLGTPDEVLKISSEDTIEIKTTETRILNEKFQKKKDLKNNNQSSEAALKLEVTRVKKK